MHVYKKTNWEPITKVINRITLAITVSIRWVHHFKLLKYACTEINAFADASYCAQSTSPTKFTNTPLPAWDTTYMLWPSGNAIIAQPHGNATWCARMRTWSLGVYNHRELWNMSRVGMSGGGLGLECMGRAHTKRSCGRHVRLLGEGGLWWSKCVRIHIAFNRVIHIGNAIGTVLFASEIPAAGISGCT